MRFNALVVFVLKSASPFIVIVVQETFADADEEAVVFCDCVVGGGGSLVVDKAVVISVIDSVIDDSADCVCIDSACVVSVPAVDVGCCVLSGLFFTCVHPNNDRASNSANSRQKIFFKGKMPPLALNQSLILSSPWGRNAIRFLTFGF